MQPEDQKIIKEVTALVYKLLENDQSGHDIHHTNRVLALSQDFAKQEKANEFLISLIALLHDVDDYKLFGKENAEALINARQIMTTSQIDSQTQEKVCAAIHEIGYGKRLSGTTPSTIESRIVSDADMCDGLGVNGILRTQAYSLSVGRPFFDPQIFPIQDLCSKNYNSNQTGINHFFEKILRLKNLMLTNSGRIEAEKRHDFIVNFLYQFFKENNTPEWSEYLTEFLKSQET